MFYVAICDDEPAICSQIEKITLEYGRKISSRMEADVYFSGEELCRNLEDGTYYDMIFLDIKLKEMSGIELGRKIRNVLKNDSVHIVYISGFTSYAMELFEIRPINFLVKPIKREQIRKALEKALKLSNKLCQTFQYKQGHRIRKIEIQNILYFESLDRKVRMVSTVGDEIFYGTLTGIFSEVEKYDFFFFHKSLLVNYYHVIKFKSEELVMTNGITLDISRNRRKSVLELQMKLEKE